MREHRPIQGAATPGTAITCLPPHPGGWRKFSRGAAPGGATLVLALLLASLPGSAVCAEPLPGPQISAKKSQLRQLDAEKEKVDRQLRTSRNSERETLQDIERLSLSVQVVRGRLKRLAARRTAQKALLGNRRGEVARLSGRISAGRRKIHAHLTRLYRLAKAGDAANLLALARYQDFFKNRLYLAALVKTDRQRIRTFERSSRELAIKQADLEKSLGEVARLEKQLTGERTKLAGEQTALRRSLTAMRKNQQTYQSYLKELARLRQGMEKAVAALEQEARPPAAVVANPNTLRGALPPPVQGAVIAPFGEQDPRYDLKKFQRGIVVRTAAEAPVQAVAAGRVVHAGPFRGYQGLVVLDHGGELFTVYGHLEAVAVSRGATVQAGALLGKSTFQPVDGNHNLYFEVRVAGKPVDPRAWLRPNSLPLATEGGNSG